MSRHNGGTHGETRSSALWGSGGRGGGGLRANALWGKGGRGFVAILAVLAVTAIPLAGASHNPPTGATYVDPWLLAKANTDPNELVNVLITSDDSLDTAKHAFDQAKSANNEQMKRELRLTGSVAVTLKARKILQLQRTPGLTITTDSRVKLDILPTSTQVWPTAEALRPFYNDTETYRAATPTIAIVDSGIDQRRADFDGGARVIADQVITTLTPNSPGDGRGHGTFVAGIAAGSATGYAGAAPQAKLVSLDVMDDNGMARTSDVIAAAQWIYSHRAERNIKVANFSLHSTLPSNFTNDPLDKAVEKLWFGGVVVVTSSGNYAENGKKSDVEFGPANDPFVITVGALDLHNSTSPDRASVAPWSTWGYTHDGFAKPELSAPGRDLVGPIPAGSTLAEERPSQVVHTADGTYMELSGTSLSAPIVSGIAADLLTLRPDLTPDEVKGALMVAARPVRHAAFHSAGVGEVFAPGALALGSPPNPNRALNAFLDPDGGDGPAFDDAAWLAAAQASPAWDEVSWLDGWQDAAWSLVSWSDVSWSDVSWSDVSWSDVSWSDVSWTDVSWSDSVYGDIAPD